MDNNRKNSRLHRRWTGLTHHFHEGRVEWPYAVSNNGSPRNPAAPRELTPPQSRLAAKGAARPFVFFGTRRTFHPQVQKAFGKEE